MKVDRIVVRCLCLQAARVIFQKETQVALGQKKLQLNFKPQLDM